GRARELTHLHQCLGRARQGVRQTVLLTGEPGIGKTTLVHAFVEALAHAGEVWLAQGQCIEHYGGGGSLPPGVGGLGPRGGGGGGGSRGARRCCRCWSSTRRRGSCRCRPCSVPRRLRRCSAGCWAPPRSAWCGSWPRPSKCSRSPGRSCWCWRICTGVIMPR